MVKKTCWPDVCTWAWRNITVLTTVPCLDHWQFRTLAWVGPEHCNTLWGLGVVGLGACIPGDFSASQKVDCPEPMLLGQIVVRKEGMTKREASAARALGSSYWEGLEGSQEGRSCPDPNGKLFRSIPGTGGSSVPQGLAGRTLERTEGICVAASCKLKTYSLSAGAVLQKAWGRVCARAKDQEWGNVCREKRN